MRRPRMLMISLIAVVVLAAATALLASSEEAGERSSGPATGRSATALDPAASDDASASSEQADVLSADRTGQRVVVRAGRELHVQVRSRSPVIVQIGPDGPIEAADTDAPAEFDLPAEQGFDETVRLVEPERVIGRITVRP